MRLRRGVAAVEFALTLPPLMLIVVGIVESSLLMHRTHQVSRVARDACRVGAMVVEGPEPTGHELEEAAREHALFGLAVAGITCGERCRVDADWVELDGWHALSVTIDVPYRGILGSLPLVPASTRASFVALTQQQVFEVED